MKILIFLIIGITTFLRAQSQFEEFINRVNSISDPAEKAAVIDSFMTVAREQGIPFIEDNTANFIYLGNVNNITVPGDFNGWDLDAAPMFNLTQTNFWYYSQDFELNARLDYKFVLNGNVWILDPENPNTIMGGFGPNSELAMPEFVQPWEIEFNPDIEHGTIEDKSIFSTHLAGTYQLKIYLPPGYNENVNYPAVYLQDGFEYVSLASAANVLDNLLDSNKITPIIGVFVKPNNRNSEYAFDKRNQYRLFFVEELVPFIDSIYNTIPEPGNRLVMGLSFGGNISALIAYNHPEVFGLCGLQSAAFWPNNFEAFNLIVNGPIKNIKWSSVWGSYESLYSNMRTFRDFLIANNYKLDWLELPEGHSWGLWRATIDNTLTYFFPASPTGVEENNELIPEQFVLYQNYPNPFNPGTIIKFSIPTSPLNPSPYQGEGHRERSITLKVYDVLGNEVATLVNEGKSAGNYEAVFNGSGLPSGIYFYKLTAGNTSASSGQGFTDTKKMILLK